MPHRRPEKRGSFGGRFDELVRQFPACGGNGRGRDDEEPPVADGEDRHINDRLFESAWRKAREGQDRSVKEQP